MRMVDLILQKRDGWAHTRTEIDFIIAGTMNGSIPDYQLASWLMAVYFQGSTSHRASLYFRWGPKLRAFYSCSRGAG